MNLNLQQSNTTKHGQSRVSLVKSQSSGKLGVGNDADSNVASSLRAAKLKIEAMQQQQKPNNNIILLRGTRNENGQIIIQNKQDILSLLSEQQQQQDKATAITLNQLPTATTVARKTIVQATTTNGGGNNSISSASSGSISIVSNASNKDTNTILLQTPINASQLESVLKAQNSAATTTTKLVNGNNNATTKLIERPFMLKHASRSLSSESNCDSKSPFVLQTLKRLEKSQSILVIRNSTAAAVTGAATPIATSPTPANSMQKTQQQQTSHVLSLTRATKAPKAVAASLQKLKAPPSSVAAAAASANGVSAAGGTTILRLSKSVNKQVTSAAAATTTTAAAPTASLAVATIANKLATTAMDQPQPQQQQQQQQTNVPLGNDGEPIKLPDNLESLPRADSFPSQRHRWNTNEEIAAILISFDKHGEWQSKEVRTRPKSGSLLLYSRKKVRYRRDGYCWKKRKDGKTTREDHMKLKVQGTECIYGCYVHSAILPTFHRRCYWLLQNPDIVLVHYLNVPYPDDNKMAVIAPSITLWGDKKEWTKEELVSQLKPMLSTVNSDEDSDSGNDIEISTAETVESIVCQLMEKQRLSRQAALVKQLDCGCGDAGCSDGKTCTHPVMRRTGILKSVSAEKRSSDAYGTLSNGSSSPNVVVASKLYSRWSERQRQREASLHLDNPHTQYHNATQQLPQESAIKFQIIPQQQQQQQQQQHHGDASNYQQQQYRGANQMLATRSNLMIQQQQQQQQQQYQQQQQHLNLQRFVASHNQSNQAPNQSNSSSNNVSNSSAHLNHRLQIANTTITATTREPIAATAAAAPTAATVMDTELIETQSSQLTTNNNNKFNHNSSSKQLTATTTATTTSGAAAAAAVAATMATQANNNELNVVNNNAANSNNFIYNQQQQQVNSASSNNSQQQQHYYKLQQTSNPNSSSNGSQQPPVEAMCMSPEHHNSNSNSNNNNDSNSNNNHNQQQQQQLRATTSSSVGSNNNNNNNNSNINSNNNSNTPSTSTTASNSSSLQSIIDGNQQQQIATTTTTTSTVAAAAVATTTNCDNLMSANAMAELELGERQQRQQLLRNYSSNNSNNSVNNQATDATQCKAGPTLNTNINSNNNINNNLHNGCATFSASSDNSSQISGHSDDSSSFGAASNNPNNNDEETPNESMSFFNETLDLSHEDIQRTLIANMPYNSNSSNNNNNINSNPATTTTGAITMTTRATASPVAVTVGHQQEAASPHPDDEDTADVFANLDAFDMLVEFPELDLDDKQALNNTAIEQQQQEQHLASTYLDSSSTPTHSQTERKLLNICDFSPEWSYTEGGVKVLVAGPWTSDGGCYTVLFDAQPVPTVLVQEGVLRCYCPAHEAGLVTLQVACGGYLVSNSAMFEYKLSLLADAPFDASSSNDCLYKFTLLNRLSTIDEKLQLKVENELAMDQTALYLEPNFEEKLVAYCHRLMKHTWNTPSSPMTSWSVGLRGMTLLHLAAALGYAKLMAAMLNWRAENPHIILETELDALSQDVHGFTPLAWACVRGHLECTLLLYKWNHNALKIKTQTQHTPLDLASLKDHKHLLAQLCRLEKERCRKPYPRGGLANLSMNLTIDSTAEEQNCGVGYELELQRRHDGVFLRPVALHSNQSPPNNSSRYSKRSSIDSGINMDMRSKSGKPMARLHGNFDSHDNYALGVDSPLDSLSTGNCSGLLSPLRKMDFALCEVSTGESSPIHDKDIDCDDNSTSVTDVTIGIGNELNVDAVVGDSDAKVLTLAEHIIAAMPERIKNEADEMMVLGSPLTEPLTSESSVLTDSFMDPLLDSLPNTHFDSDFSFDFHDHSYRYHDVSTPCSSLSPASSGPLQSPASYSILGTDPSVSSPSPPPSTKQLTEFLHASSISQYPFEADFSKLTLTDTEQRELYEAAKCIQKAYRSYKGRQKLEEQNKERTAAIVIQNYYRRYKQYAYYRQMTNAALVIQHGYRSYRRNKRFKKSQHTPGGMAAGSEHGSVSSNSQCLSSFYDHYKQEQIELSSQPSTPKETSPSGPLKRTYSQSTQNQAARKIQQFMRQSRIKLQRERAEKEKLVHQRRAEYLQNLQFQGQQEMSVCHNENVNNNNNSNCNPNQ